MKKSINSFWVIMAFMLTVCLLFVACENIATPETPSSPETPSAVSFRIEHYQENANDNGYTLIETETFTDITESQALTATKNYPHFTFGMIMQDSTNAYGIKQIRIYYKLETITLTLNLDGGTLDGETNTLTRTGKYGQTVTINNPNRTGYNFVGWNTVGESLPSTFYTNATYTARWSTTRGISITANDTDIHVNKTINGNTITFIADDCDSYNWTLDETTIGTEKNCIINTSSLRKGTYTLALEVRKSGRLYSYYAQIKVE